MSRTLSQVPVPSRFLIFGHRGSPGVHPENTLASFEEALRAGADGFETDLRMLADRTAVLFHDDDLDGDEIETLHAPILDTRRPLVLRAGELADLTSRTTMILEVKRSRWEDELLALIAGWNDVIISSFDHSILEELHRRKATVPLGIVLHGFLVGLPRYARALGATWCFPNYRFVDSTLVRQLHDEGIRVVPWTPNREGDWIRLIEAGCDGIITDEPAAAVTWRSRLL